MPIADGAGLHRLRSRERLRWPNYDATPKGRIRRTIGTGASAPRDDRGLYNDPKMTVKSLGALCCLAVMAGLLAVSGCAPSIT